MDARWVAVIASSVIAFALKFSGNIIPEKYLENPKVKSISAFVPIVMLSALVVVQTFGVGQALVIDARVVGLIFAVILLLIRAPFIVVVFGAATIAAILRYFNLTN
jgi:branched-subunit amino acid transport protein